MWRIKVNVYDGRMDAGMLLSTCYVQLLLAGVYIGIIAAALLHPQFWLMLGRNISWPISFLFIALWHKLSQRLLNLSLIHI